MNRLDTVFERLRAEHDLGLFPYLMTGYPDPTTCARLLDCVAAAGADGIELGVPFSDPLADGVTIQRVGAAALEQGASVQMALELVRQFRTRWQTPVVLMSYYNLLLAYGTAALCRDSAAAGLDGFIVPDLPLEEAGPFQGLCRDNGLHVITMLAPTSTDSRLDRAGKLASGFIYCVALLGVTGARSELSDELPAFLQRVRAQTAAPLVVGFGISRAEHVRAVRGIADGVIVASSLADLIDASPREELHDAVSQYVRDLKAAARPVGGTSVSERGAAHRQTTAG